MISVERPTFGVSAPRTVSLGKLNWFHQAHKVFMQFMPTNLYLHVGRIYEYVSMSTLDSICKYFHCKIEDIIEFIE